MEEIVQLREKTQLWALRDAKRGKRRGVTAWALVDLALSTGLRVSELAAIKAEDFDYDRGFVFVTRAKKRQAKKDKKKDSKPTEREPLAIDRAVLAHIKDCLGGRAEGPLFIGSRGPLTAQGLQRLWLSAIDRAKLPHYSIHAARHSIAMQLLENTNNLRLVQKQLGHLSPITTANLYVDIRFEKMQQAVSDLYERKKI